MKPEAHHSKRLLAINFGGLGDEILFLPTLRSIKQAQPGWHVTLLTEPRARSVADVTEDVDNLLTFDIKKKPLRPGDYWQLLSLLRSGKFDCILSSGSSPQVAALLFLSGIPKRIGFGTSAVSRALLTDPVPLNKHQHATLMYHELTRGLGIESAAGRPQIAVDTDALTKMRGMLPENARKVVLLHPGASLLAMQKGVCKTWDAQNWSQLIERLLADGYTVVLAGGPDDRSTVETIIQGATFAEHPQFMLAFGKTGSLKDLVALMQLSDVIVCVDSAPMHLAVGLNKPLVALFGPTDAGKLLWPAPHFIALQDKEALLASGGDPFAKAKLQSDSQPMRPVQIPLETVHRSVLDLLNATASQGSSREYPDS